MECTIINKPPGKRIIFSGQLTFADNQKFKQVMDIAGDHAVTSVTLDFAGIDFIDSAGLGMLLMLRDECQNRQISIAIESAKGQVEKVFMLSKFDQLFTMHP